MPRTATCARSVGFEYSRPSPPPELSRPGLGFLRAMELERFVRLEFLARGGIFWDPAHGHLKGDEIGFVWAASRHSDRGSLKAGTARLLKTGEPSKWGEGMQRCLLHQMFGHHLPSFLITLYAPACAIYSDREFFALVDHELSHCTIAKDEYGAPRFNQETGKPVYAIQPHDFEGFAGSVERWGAVATGAASIVTAGVKRPRFDWVPGEDLDIQKVCGS